MRGEVAVEKAAIVWNGGTVSAAWHHPLGAATWVVLGHGAGGNMHTPGLVKFATALASQGIAAVRFNFPYAEARRKAPDRRATLETCYRAAATAAAERADRLVNPDLLQQTMAALPNARLHVVDGADHGLRTKGRDEEDVVTEIARVAVDWIALLPPKKGP